MLYCTRGWLRVYKLTHLRFMHDPVSDWLLAKHCIDRGACNMQTLRKFVSVTKTLLKHSQAQYFRGDIVSMLFVLIELENNRRQAARTN